MTSLTCAALQFNLSLGNVDANLDRALAGLRRVARQEARLAVLPEMWSSGYDYRNLRQLAKQTPRVLEQVCAECRELGLVTVGSLPELDGEQFFNTAYVIDRGELIASYRKLHLFSTMKEDRFLAAGSRTLVADTSVGRLGVAICYDLRFPELFRKLAMEGAEILCIPAEWPKPRQVHWQTLLRARAIENQCFVVASNCCNIQGKIDFCGLSRIISPLGDILAEADEGSDSDLVATLDFQEMTDYREQIKILNDRRADIYGTP